MPRWIICVSLLGIIGAIGQPVLPAESAATVCLPLLYSQGPPATQHQPVTDVYHGIRVTDPYRWLENWDDPAVKAWSGAQNSAARTYLDALPGRAALYKQITDLLSRPTARFASLVARGGKLFAMRFQPPKEQPFLVILDAPDRPESARTLLDPQVLDASGRTTIDFFVPSVDGKYVAVSLSKGGSESGDVHVYETATGKALPDVVARVNGGTAGGSVAWNAEGTGFYYTRYPRSGERPTADIDFFQQVWFHRLGTPDSSDTYSLGKDFPRIAEIALDSSLDGRYVLATMANGDGGEYALYLLPPSGQWIQLASLADRVIKAAFGSDSLYLLSRQNAPKGKLLRMPLTSPKLSTAKVVVPEAESAVGTFVATPKYLYVAGIAGGPSDLRAFFLDGTPRGKVAIEENSTVRGLLGYEGDTLLFQGGSYVTPSGWYRYDPASRKIARTALRDTAGPDFSDIAAVREFATSKDGTRVPLTILYKKGTERNGSNPTLLYGYGGYGISLQPGFDPTLRPLFDRGVVFAVANLRGGGEYGDGWHLAGNLTRKQNVFDDFTACAQHLIARKYTSSGHLAIEGGSNGGLLMGAALTQHPELYRAVVSHVGIYDMLRVELSPNGAFNVTEFGTVKESDHFRALYAYSPYHNVKDGTAYPPILFLTGVNDPRVDPMQSRKMTARLQASGTKNPVLLRTSSTSGHGIGTALSEAIDELTDVYAFLFAQWGLK